MQISLSIGTYKFSKKVKLILVHVYMHYEQVYFVILIMPYGEPFCESIQIIEIIVSHFWDIHKTYKSYILK